VFTVGLIGYVIYREGTLPVDKTDKKTGIFVIKPGDSLNKIANNLALEGYIRNKIVFYVVVKQQGAEKKIQAGDFRLSPSMDTFDIVKTLQHGTLDTWVTVVEGLRKEEVAQIMNQNFNISEIDFISQAEEGYLFPDTYLIPSQATSKNIIALMTNTFSKKFTQLKEKSKTNLSDKEVVILASLVEREAKHYEDRRIVAGILLKRLNNDWPLQLDATVQYALGYQTNGKTWWKKAVNGDDLKIDSPYNTYKYPGMPPGPICNPSLTSLEAVINANKSTPYWYYLSDSKGNMHYAVTLEEQEANVEKYLN
jgi:UPF0755 protein